MADSIACPNVWPKFKCALILLSFSSFCTIDTLAFTETVINLMSESVFLSRISFEFLFNHFKKDLSPIAPYFITSASPEVNCFFDKVCKKIVSMRIASGCLKLPIKFLPLLWLIPDLPPIDESTCASRVVGICIRLTPLRKVSEANPTKSPITPPPKAMIVKSLLSLFLIK